jgi:hypothetical protein
MSQGVVDPMEVFAAMTASLLEKQPQPFNPMYAIKPSCARPLKIGGKPPREIFYRDTLTFMTSLPPPVQPKLCTCKYLCNGEKATIICHSCSIYDPTKAAYYCVRCFPSRHPWYRVPHLHTPIENDESISHTLKIAHRIAEVSRYDNEGKNILRKVQNQKPNLAFVADDEKVDNQLRVYGRKVTALEEHVQQLRERLQRDIMFGDIVPHRRNLYSKTDAETAHEQELLQLGDDSSVATPVALDSARAEHPQPQAGMLYKKLDHLRREPIFDSEPLFTSLLEEGDAPETSPSDSTTLITAGALYRAGHAAVAKPAVPFRAPLLRGDTSESSDSMTLSPDEERGFFRENSNMNLVRSAGPGLAAIDEAESVVTEGVGVDQLSGKGVDIEGEGPAIHVAGQTTLSINSAEPMMLGGADAVESPGVSSQGLRRVLSGVSFTSVAHSDIDSVTAPAFRVQIGQPRQHGSSLQDGRRVALPTQPSAATAQSNSNWLNSLASAGASHGGSVSTMGSGTSANSGHSGDSNGSGASGVSDLTGLSRSSTNIQRVFKGYLARRTVSKMLTTRLLRVFSLENNRGTKEPCIL